MINAVSFDFAATAWVLISAILVLLMIVPGLLLFYSGESRSSYRTEIVAQSLIAAAIVGLLWFFGAFNLAFAPLSELFKSQNLWTQSAELFGGSSHIPAGVFAFFQLAFATMGAALLLGAFIGRITVKALILFMTLWLFSVYVPIAHMAWAADGFIAALGAVDFAGGGVVHVDAGVSGLVACLLLSRKKAGDFSEFKTDETRTLLGGALIWIGWFGFNAGSALQPDVTAGVAMISTQLGALAGLATYGVLSYAALKRVVPSSLMIGALAGLVGVTPCAGWIEAQSAILIGSMAALGAFIWIRYAKPYFKIDDRLDVFGLHGVPGMIGALATGLFCSPVLSVNWAHPAGIGANFGQFIAQLESLGVIIGWAIGFTALSLGITRLLLGSSRFYASE